MLNIRRLCDSDVTISNSEGNQPENKKMAEPFSSCHTTRLSLTGGMKFIPQESGWIQKDDELAPRIGRDLTDSYDEEFELALEDRNLDERSNSSLDLAPHRLHAAQNY